MFSADKFKQTPLVFISISFMSGLILGATTLAYFPSFILLIFGLILLFLTNERYFVIGILVCTFSFGWQLIESEKDSQTSLRKIATSIHEKNIHFRGELQDLKPTEKGFKYRIELEKYSGFGIWLYSENELNTSIGDTLFGEGEFQEIASVRNPGEFDFQGFYNRKGLFGWVFPHKHSTIKIVKNNRWNFAHAIQNVRNNIRLQINKYTSGTAAGLLNALILGDKSDVEPEVRESFADTGVIHVLAVSGLHVGYVLIALLLMKNIFRLPWGWDRLIIIGGLVFFVLLTGGKASVIRASIMAGLFVIAPVFNRKANIWNIIGASAFIILMWRPLDVFDLGFQLSFLAVISIIFFYNWFETVLPEKLQVSQIQNSRIQFFWGLFLVSIAAQIGTLPLTAYIFGKIPIIALVANVLIVPLIGLLVGVGFFLLFLGWIPGVGFALGNSAWLLTKVITTLTTFFAGIPFGIIRASFDYFHILLYSLLVVALTLVFTKGRRKYGFFFILIIFNFIVWKWSMKTENMDIIFMDVGQGDAAIVTLPNNKTMLIDAGQRNRHEDFGERVVLPVLKTLGVDKLDWVVMSHPHSDHIGGLVTIIKEIPIDTLWDSFIPYSSWTYKNIIENAEKNNTIIFRPKSGSRKFLSENIYVQFFSPDSAIVVQDHNVNNSSIVFKLVYGKTRILFTGDLEHEGDEFLLPYGKLLESDVLKVAHHGSITSTTDPLLKMINPKLAIVSVGWKNKFKHPSPIIIDRLKNHGVEIHRTDLKKALWLRSNGEDFKVVEWN